MVKPSGKLDWSIAELSKALKISQSDVKSYFKDGRRISFILERRLALEVVHGKLAASEGAGFDLTDANGKKWEVRSISKGGVYFRPSSQVGSGRAFEETGFLAKLDSIDGYILCDIEDFPDVPFWIVSVEVVRGWYNTATLKADASVSRKKILKLLGEL